MFTQLKYPNETFNHNKFDCPKLHYFPWKKAIFQKYIKTSGHIQKRIVIYNRKNNRSTSCFLLRRILFKKYETKRFINEKKKLERLVKDSILTASNNMSRRKKKLVTGFSKYRKNTIVSL